MITHVIRLDMQQPGPAIILHANQGEIGAREIRISLFNGGAVWAVPESAHAIVLYHRPNGTGGSYDVLEDNQTAAVTLNAARTEVTVSLAENVCAFADMVTLKLLFTVGSAQTYTFNWFLFVHPSQAGSDAAAQNYYAAFTGILEGWETDLTALTARVEALEAITDADGEEY